MPARSSGKKADAGLSMLPPSAVGSVAEAGIGPLLPPPSPVAVPQKSSASQGGGWLPPPSPVAVRAKKDERAPRKNSGDRRGDAAFVPPPSPVAVRQDPSAAAMS